MTQSRCKQLIGTAFQRFRFCPGCGSDSFIHTTGNSLVCSHCGFVYFINPPVSVLALIKNQQGKLLLTRRRSDPAKGKYDFPGGFVDMQETLEAALEREILEELNLHICDLRYYTSISTVYPFQGLVYHPVDAVFYCNVKDWSRLEIKDDVDSIVYKWPTEIDDDDLAFESNRQLIEKLKAESES